MPNLDAMAEDIRTMRVRGAGKIARHAARALAAWAEDAGADAATADAFHEGAHRAARRLLETRPSAVSLRNSVQFVMRRVDAADTLDAKREALAAAVDAFVTRSREAVDAIARHGADAIEDGGVYLTHCNSQAAIGVLVRAWQDGKRFRAYATETRPWRQGLLTSRQLAEAGVDTTFIVDSAAFQLFPRLSGVVVGCDTIAANGDVVNKVGTGMFSLAAREHGVPFHVCGETYKVALDVPSGADVPIEERTHDEVVDGRDFHPDVRIENPVFDVTPADRVTDIVTEMGRLPPREVAEVARKHWA